MGLYWKTTTAALIAVLLMLILRRQEIGIMLAMVVCAMTAMAAVEYLGPVWDLVDSLKDLAELDGDMIEILLKAMGITLVTEIGCMICADSGSTSLGKALQLLGTAVVLWMSVPLFTGLIDLIRNIVEAL